MPVAGTSSAASPRTCGSRSRSPAASSHCVSTSFSAARACSAARRGSSAALVATTTLPHTSWRMPRAAQKSSKRRRPSRVKRDFKLPGL